LGYAKNRIICNGCDGVGYIYTVINHKANDYEREWCYDCGGSGEKPNPDWLDILLGRYE
jgi:hypothetical protein